MNNLSILSSILEKKEFKEIYSIKEELSDAWHKKQIFRTDTEARHGVLNDFKYPTKAAKYWQAVKEQVVHFDELFSLSFSLQRKYIDLEEIEDQLDNAALSSFEERRLKIDRDECLFSIASGKQVAKDRVREVLQWSRIKEEINDGSFDDKDVNTHQKESLFKSVLNRATVASDDISTEERLTIKGILHSLGNYPANKEILDKMSRSIENKKV